MSFPLAGALMKTTATYGLATRWGRGLLATAGLLLLATPAPVTAQTTIQEVSVLVSAVVRRSPAQIRLTWSSPTSQPATFTVFRRGQGETSWGLPLLVSTAAITSYDDDAVRVGVPYEYRVVRNSNDYPFEGYTLAGIEVPAIERRGTLVLVVADTHAAYLAPELAQLQADLVGDGWQVLRHDVAPTLAPPQVKALIKADYQAAPTDVRAVFLVGHVAVPYAGEIFPDGHPDHFGAWPADVYYGDMLGTWTDTQANTSTAYRPENRNIPGDGKFDQNTPPGGVQLAVGRADMSQLSLGYFNLTEANLLQRYLRKDHDFRHKVFSVPERGLVEDHFFSNGAGGTFANLGWGNFSALVGEANVQGVGNGGYFATLRTQPHLLALASGGGNFFGANRVGDVRQFGSQPVYSVFNMMGGSYFGDWDNPDNFLRGAIAGEGYSLTNCWGYTYWAYHLMGLGETVGYATAVTQNGGVSTSTYPPEIWAALMGDPSLRLHPLAPPTAAAATAAAGRAQLSWTASPAPVLGYYVYRAARAGGPFTRLTPQPVAATAFADASPLPGTATYLVRAMALKTGPSGSYYNLSQGAFATFTTATLPPVTATWRGTQSTDWQTPANWNIGRVPTTADAVVVAGATPFAPTLGGQYPYEVASLTLQAGATLTVAGGSSLALPTAPVLLPGSGSAPTTLALATGTPGGQLLVQDRTAPAGLTIAAGTALTVADGAELTLAGNLTHKGGTVAFAPLGRLVLAHGGGSAGYRHTLAGPAPTTAGVLVLTAAADTLALTGPLAVSTRVENLGTVLTHDQLTLLAGPGEQAILAPVVPGLQRTPTLGTYVGNLTVQVRIDGSRNAGLGYRHLAAPVAGSTVAGLATGAFVPVTNLLYNTVGNTVRPFPTVFRYDEVLIGASSTPGPVGFDQGWFSPYDNAEPLFPGLGYTVNMPGNATVGFTGQPYTQPDFVLNTYRGTAADGGWEFVGNPYPAPLSWDRLFAAADLRLAGIDPALYTFKSSGQYAGTYASYLPGAGGTGIGVNGGTGTIPMGQAFFIRTTAPNFGGYLRFTLDDVLTTTDGRTVQRTAADLRPRLVLALRDAAGTQAHQTAVYFQAGATAGADARLDAPLLPGPGQALTVATVVAGKNFSINGLPPLNGAEVRVPLRLSATAAGRYKLATETLLNLPAPYHAYLHDAATNTYTDLAQPAPVSVALPANAPVTGRYTLVFSPQARVLATAPAALAAQTGLYPNPAHGSAVLLLPAGLPLPQGGVALLRNALGQVVRRVSCPLGRNEVTLPLTGLAPGIYTVQMGIISRRLVVE